VGYHRYQRLGISIEDTYLYEKGIDQVAQNGHHPVDSLNTIAKPLTPDGPTAIVMQPAVFPRRL
jgi:hypothetical protein